MPSVQTRPLRRRDLLVSFPTLLGAFVVVTTLAIEPLHEVDVVLRGRWLLHVLPSWEPFFQHVLDRIAGQAVDAPVLVAVALALAVRRRTWRPLLVAAAVEAGFYGVVGLMKLAFARPSPVLGDPAFFHGGLWQDGWAGISFPSGHTAESVLVYGAVVHLLASYSRLSRRVVKAVAVAVGVVALDAGLVSFLLGWHWTTDLLGGWLAGGLVLRGIVLGDRWLPRRVGRLPDDVEHWAACARSPLTTTPPSWRPPSSRPVTTRRSSPPGWTLL
jgi:undecaprenyl-diphosphatase